MRRAVWLAAALVLTVPPPNPPERRATVAGAYARALDAMELANREYQLQRRNRGAGGRINSLRLNARQSEVPPLGTPPLHGDW
jgi:hypothetical protein